MSAAFYTAAIARSKAEPTKQLFTELLGLAQQLETGFEEFRVQILANRSRRECKPIRLSREAKNEIRDHQDSAHSFRHSIASDLQAFDDAALVRVALKSESATLRTDEGMMSAWHADDQAKAASLLSMQRAIVEKLKAFSDAS